MSDDDDYAYDAGEEEYEYADADEDLGGASSAHAAGDGASSSAAAAAGGASSSAAAHERRPSAVLGLDSSALGRSGRGVLQRLDTDTHTLSSDMLGAAINEKVESLAEALGIDAEEALLLMVHYKWNSRALEDRWWDQEADLRARAGVAAGGDPAKPPAPVDGGAATVMDPLTLEEVPIADADACACGHFFPRKAWTAYLEDAAATPLAILATRCIARGDGCGEVVRPRMFRAYLSPEGWARYQLAVVKAFVQDDPTYAWCPAPDCDYAVTYTGGGQRDVQCGRGHLFCFKCGSQAHAPARCADLVKWLKREGDDGENSKWLLANTKPCPACKKSIEKNQGCNHMTCRRDVGGCAHEFCWVCMEPWHAHVGNAYTCNKRPPAGLYDEDAAKSSQAELAHYSFYYERYGNNRRSEEHAAKSVPEVLELQRVLQALLECRWDFVEFLENAVRAVVVGRRVQRWSYVHGFYLPSGPELALFEFAQATLERNLEALHHDVEVEEISRVVQTEPPADSAQTKKEALMAWRTRVVNLTTSTSKYVADLVSAVENNSLLLGAGLPAAGASSGAGAGAGGAASADAGSGSGNGSDGSSSVDSVTGLGMHDAKRLRRQL